MAKLLSCLLMFLPLLVLKPAEAQGLEVGYYRKTCPQAEAIVKKTIDEVISVAPSLAAPLLRMHFHDCFVRGCDGSVLLNSSTQQAEKDAIPNLSLRGYHIIDKVKAALEKACPRVVSCADIVALVARDAVVALKGPSWQVETGRKDGRVSNLAEAMTNLPSPFHNMTQLKAGFSVQGLSTKDLVVLSGAHTIGITHCIGFSSRLYNFTGRGDTDPSLDPNYIPKLRSKCRPGDLNSFAEMDSGSFKTFDSSYYKLVAKRRGIFVSDAQLLLDSETRAYVKAQATASSTSTFFKDFGKSMIRMGRIGVKTGRAGEVRKQCTRLN